MLVGAIVVGRMLWQIFRPSGRPRERPPRALTPHEVLGVDRNATPAEVQKAYRRLVREYHPDRIDGMADELRDLARRRMAEINAAYDALNRDRR